MTRFLRLWVAFVGLALACMVHVAKADPPLPPTGLPRLAAADGGAPAATRKGVAVVAVGNVRDEAYDLARAVYKSRLRPTSLDEVRARVLAGGAIPANASRELRELGELRAGIVGDGAAARRVLGGIAQQVGVEALLVVFEERGASEADAGVEEPSDAAAASTDGTGESRRDGNTQGKARVVARVFLTDAGDWDAARYYPAADAPNANGASAWNATVTSLQARFGVAEAAPSEALRPAPPSMRPQDEKSRPFYASAWFWGAFAGAAVLGGAFYFATRDTTSETIHLEMRVPK